MWLQSFCLLFALCGFAEEPKSAALIQTLPPDGTWVTFQATIKLGNQEQILTWTIRSVGQAFHGGKQCRILEMEQTSESPQFPAMTWRVVVAEEEFGNGKHPLGKPGKVWRKLDKQESEVIESIDVADLLFATLLKGPVTNVKTEEAKEKISWQQGNLECQVISGSSEIGLGTAKLEWKQRVFRHEKIPFGFAGLRVDLHVDAGGDKQTIAIQLNLQDHGKDAKPKLPELLP